MKVGSILLEPMVKVEFNYLVSRRESSSSCIPKVVGLLQLRIRESWFYTLFYPTLVGSFRPCRVNVDHRKDQSNASTKRWWWRTLCKSCLDHNVHKLMQWEESLLGGPGR